MSGDDSGPIRLVLWVGNHTASHCEALVVPNMDVKVRTCHVSFTTCTASPVAPDLTSHCFPRVSVGAEEGGETCQVAAGEHDVYLGRGAEGCGKKLGRPRHKRGLKRRSL